MLIVVVQHAHEATPRPIYLNDGQPWTAFDEIDLMNALDKGRSLEETATVMQRSPDILTYEAAIRKRLFDR